MLFALKSYKFDVSTTLILLRAQDRTFRLKVVEGHVDLFGKRIEQRHPLRLGRLPSQFLQPERGDPVVAAD